MFSTECTEVEYDLNLRSFAAMIEKEISVPTRLKGKNLTEEEKRIRRMDDEIDLIMRADDVWKLPKELDYIELTRLMREGIPSSASRKYPQELYMADKLKKSRSAKTRKRIF